MDRNLLVSTLLMLLYLTTYVSGEMIPENVTLHMWEGNVTITWDPPQENPGDYLYQVQLNKYIDTFGEWQNVSHCNLLKATICNIGYLSAVSNFRVRVGVLTTQNNISWSVKRRINIRNSQLFAPTFTLSSTSYSVRIKIQRKQILEEIFPYNVQYTVYLWPEGQEKQTLKMTNDNTDDDGEMTFSSLKPLKVYCVLVEVQSTSSSTNSTVHCIKLPLDATLIICFILLGLFCMTVFLILFICFLRRPRKMPSALNLFVNVWKPMIIKSDEVETVTDKGWTFITNTMGTKQIAEFTEENKERRESLDSGVSIEQLPVSSAKIVENIEDVQVDSGCESLKETEVSGSTRGVTRQFSTHELHCSGKNEGTGDSGLGLVHHEVSGFLEGEDTALLSKVLVGDGYRSQSPASVDVQNDLDSNMAAPSAGYRSGQVTCMCSDHEYCIWCKCKNPFTEGCQPVGQSQTDIGQTDDGSSVSSRYKIKSLMQTVNLLHMENPVTEPTLPDNNCTDSSLNLLSCPLLLQKEQKQDSLMTFTLDTVELTFS
ncbi:interleukin-10 receptor subunit alpha isoform X1 [Silurus meridionalis]|uniref:Uncharacterized protein n=2 Tax=Silurus meridionalis TaxID=175797 RepID=A0A8T0B638_SILME|nr:interleukin-10 receptor subunit alpha isoform X1 [Silurus meridionalis]KAF7699806.1 hypothetical protein HF521_002764 [Silurus meridionalis]